MTAIEFWNAFSKKVMDEGDDRTQLCKDWTTSKVFTDSMSKVITSIIEGNYGKENITVQPEYLRIDIPAWQKNSGNDHNFVEEAPNFQKYDWNLKVAVEHENDYRLWMDEVIKLAHINCPLRVVIGYVHVEKDRDTTEKKQKAILKRVASVLNNNIDAWKTILSANKNNQSEFLIILGDGNVRAENRCYYTPYFYSFDKKEFVDLEDYLGELK